MHKHIIYIYVCICTVLLTYVSTHVYAIIHMILNNILIILSSLVLLSLLFRFSLVFSVFPCAISIISTSTAIIIITVVIVDHSILVVVIILSSVWIVWGGFRPVTVLEGWEDHGLQSRLTKAGTRADHTRRELPSTWR